MNGSTVIPTDEERTSLVRLAMKYQNDMIGEREVSDDDNADVLLAASVPNLVLAIHHLETKLATVKADFARYKTKHGAQGWGS